MLQFSLTKKILIWVVVVLGFLFAYIKQTQFICHTLVMMLQASLCPTENMQTLRTCSQSPDYPGQESKLKHFEWLDEHLLKSSRSALTAHLGSYSWNEEYCCARVIEATNIFIGLWYPNGSPRVPDLDVCIRLNGELPCKAALAFVF